MEKDVQGQWTYISGTILVWFGLSLCVFYVENNILVLYQLEHFFPHNQCIKKNLVVPLI